MTRGEEIKARLVSSPATPWENKNGNSLTKFFGRTASEDIRYLLARNEELQRRADRLEMALTGIKEEAAKFATDESVIGYTCIGIYTCAESALAKEQDDDQAD